ncbi:MAG: ABC transporter permease subunit [Chloroflexi bacterium]|nr:MAG: ABC transporter permease subunit [Chloroflexota bacterium]
MHPTARVTPTAARRVRGPSLRRSPHWVTGYWLSLPALSVVLGLLAYPVAYDVVLSLTSAHEFAASGPYVGLANYGAILADPRFWTGVRYFTFWIPATVLLEVAVGLATALLLWWRFWGRTLLFVAVFVPWAFPASFSAFAWYSIFVPPFFSFYTHRAVLLKFWLEDHFGRGTMDFAALSAMGVWRVSSIMAIFLLAGLNTIPRDLIDYARLEARSPLNYFWNVLLPLLRRYLVLAAMIGVVITFIDFDSIYLESAQRTTVPVVGTLAYQRGILLGDTGYAAALNVISLPVLLLVALVGLRLISPNRDTPAPAADVRLPERSLFVTGLLQRSGRGAPRTPRLPLRWRRRLIFAAGTFAAILVVVFHLFPVYFVYNQAVVPVQELALGQPFFVFHPDYSNFHDAAIPGPLWLWARNTLVAFGGAILIGTTLSMLAGYGLARFKPPGAELLAKLAFASFFVPQFAVLVPLYAIYAATALDNTLRGLLLIYLTMVVPFSTWLFYVYFQGLDPSVEEHAWLDGNRRQAFVRIVVPMSWPVFVASALFSLGILGSDIVYGSALALSDSVKTLPVGLGLSAISLDEWANVSADMLVASLPLIVLCAILGRSFVQGIQAALLEGA